ncbi:MAG: serine/threonine-protein kinase [Ktedonobacterales bacterium]
MQQSGRSGSLSGQILGEYQLGLLLGVGGMAEVYHAQDLTLNREVAVKVLAPRYAQDPEYVSRFRVEARRASAVHHPNIIPVYAYGEEHGLLYLVMPLLRQSLRDVLQRQGRLAPTQAIRVTLEIAAALEVAHAQGLIHRDVKPANILLDADGHALLSDFGIAREVPDPDDPAGPTTLAASGMPIGTPEYMAPEQFDDATRIDQRADVYALGVVLYEALTGAPPFRAPTPYGVAALVMTASPESPSSRNPAIGSQLEQVVLQALAKRPDDRYHDIRAFAAALRQRDLTTLTTLDASSDPQTLAPWVSSRRLANTDQAAATQPLSGEPDPGSRIHTPAPLSASSTVATVRANTQRRSRRTLLLLVATSLLIISLGVCGGGLYLTGGGLGIGPGGDGNLHGGAATVTSGSGSGSVTSGATGTAGAQASPQSNQTPGATTTTTANPSVTVTGTVTGTPTVGPTPTETPQPPPTATPCLLIFLC